MTMTMTHTHTHTHTHTQTHTEIQGNYLVGKHALFLTDGGDHLIHFLRHFLQEPVSVLNARRADWLTLPTHIGLSCFPFKGRHKKIRTFSGHERGKSGPISAQFWPPIMTMTAKLGRVSLTIDKYAFSFCARCWWAHKKYKLQHVQFYIYGS